MPVSLYTHVPVLLTKRGELRAVQSLPSTIADGVVPLFAVHPVKWDFERQAPKKTLDEHLESVVQGLHEHWAGRPAFVDLPFIDCHARVAGGQHPLEMVFTVVSGGAGSALLTPVVAMSRDAAHRRAVRRVAAQTGRGACLRLTGAEWTPSPADIDTLLASIGLVPDEVDLVLDLGEAPSQPLVAALAVRGTIAALPYLKDWRSLTFASAAFPRDTQGGTRKVTVHDRTDWAAYELLVRAGGLTRVPAFGDYAIASPDPGGDIDPRLMSISAQMRYTVDGAWLVAKGELFKGAGGRSHGATAMRAVAAKLLADQRFAGVAHCTADAWLDEVARGTSGGNPEMWRRYGTAHHLIHVQSELASLHGLSASGGPLLAAG